MCNDPFNDPVGTLETEWFMFVPVHSNRKHSSMWSRIHQTPNHKKMFCFTFSPKGVDPLKKRGEIKCILFTKWLVNRSGIVCQKHSLSRCIFESKVQNFLWQLQKASKHICQKLPLTRAKTIEIYIDIAWVYFLFDLFSTISNMQAAKTWFIRSLNLGFQPRKR